MEKTTKPTRAAKPALKPYRWKRSEGKVYSLAFFPHHDVPVAILTEPAKVRIAYIKAYKPPEQLPLRLAAFMPVPDKWVQEYLKEAYAAWKEATAAREEAAAALEEATAAREEAAAASKKATAAREEAAAALKKAIAAWEKAHAAWSEATAAWEEATATWEEAIAAWKEATAASKKAIAAWKEATAASKKAHAAWEKATAAREEAAATLEEALERATPALLKRYREAHPEIDVEELMSYTS